MPEDVRRYPFVFEAGARSLGDRLAKQQMDGEAGQRFSTDAGKCDGCWLCLEFAEPLLQDLRGAWPERDHAVLPAFSVQLDIAFRGDRDLVALESGDLRDTSSGVVESQQQRIISPAAPLGPIDGREDGLYLFARQVGTHLSVGALEWNGEHMRGDAGAGWIAERNHAIKRTDGCEAQVARDDAVATVLFETVEKAENVLGIQAGHGKSGGTDASLAIDELKQQA